MIHLKKILVPIDFSKEAELSVQWAVKLGKEEPEAMIILMHVLTPAPVMEGGFEIEKLIQIQWDSAKEKLEEWRRKIPEPLLSSVLLGKGDAVEEIMHRCEQEDIDLVIMTTRARTGLSRIIHPNLSEKAVRAVPCPVLVLHLNSKGEAVVNKRSAN